MLAYLQLLRLPNVFTAAADVMLGFVFVQAGLEPRATLGVLLGASCLLYCAGMVLNDVFDRDLDAQERPERPIPSGRVPYRLAALLATQMLILGAALGWVAAYLVDDLRPGAVASVLALTVVLYDAIAKRTPLGPVAMGTCRTLNVLLGMSAAPGAWSQVHFVIALGVGTYIVGVTWFARTEADVSRRRELIGGIAVMVAGMGLAASYPWWGGGHVAPALWWPAWALLAASVLWRCVYAIVQPLPVLVQRAVKNCLLSLILIDAVLTLPVTQPLGVEFASILIVALMFPAIWLGRWVYST